GTSPSHFDEVPMLEDVRTISEVLRSLGIKVESKEKNCLDLDSTVVESYEPPCERMRNMRASFFVMGPLLARMGKARIYMPGGCAIGARPVDIHLKGFEALGVVLDQQDGFIEATTPNGLKGATIYFDFPSVGATENVMMAAALAEGVTILENAAEEPEIVALASYLNKMGAKIRGAGTDVIRIEGVKELHGADYTIIPDRIEAGTYMIAAAMTGGDVIVDNVLPEHQKPLIAKLREAGAIVEEDIDKVRVIGNGTLKGVSVKTLPYPGFPTDMQAQIMAMMVVSEGKSKVTETVFENRFMHVEELNRMGATITTSDRSANIEGPARLVGCDVRATDLRAGAAMILAGLVAEGETRIGDLYHIDRGYEDIVEKLKNLGADIERVDV
ncbi:MAG: UDP-N-acetylglucosamine 1-carboxyvinyltransferase, partial [Phascolarctobacterium sp.]|nr:UDP-N-acetylglucosamine 1-carboxyvinyltransferase [Phascolarctobacterium sp.]